MIGYIRGTLMEFVQNQGLVLTPGGAGYMVYLPSAYYSKPIPSEVAVYTYLHVREDALVLYGFTGPRELELFSLVHSVNGVGPKTAYAIVSYGSPEQLANAVRSNDVSYFTGIPGLGKKTALKLILELGSKLNADVSLHKLHLNHEDTAVLQAVTALGFSRQESQAVIPEIDRALPYEERIKIAIQRLTAKK